MDQRELDELREAFSSVRGTYQTFGESLRILFAQLLDDIDIESIDARAKEIESLVEKARRKPEYASLADVTDKCGVRVVTRYQADIDRVVNLIRGEFDVRETVTHGQERPDAFGYLT